MCSIRSPPQDVDALAQTNSESDDESDAQSSADTMPCVQAPPARHGRRRLAIATNAVAVEVCLRVAVRFPMTTATAAITDGWVAVQASMNRRAYECQIAPPVVLLIPVAMMNLGARRQLAILLFGRPSVRLNPLASSGILVLSVASGIYASLQIRHRVPRRRGLFLRERVACDPRLVEEREAACALAIMPSSASSASFTSS